MAEQLRFDNRVVIVTGAGNGLGRAHALLFASRGAKVVVNDLGGSSAGDGASHRAADVVVNEIKAAGGEAVANYNSVADGAAVVQTALDAFGRVDVVVNNAGILRDKTFAKMSQEDWDLVYLVHVLGAQRVTMAAWPHLREQKYGRILMTSSAAGLYGNFGQANYSMAKLALVGFASTLALEGHRANVHVNTIAPIAGSRMTEGILPPNLLAALRPELVSPLVAFLAHESCEETGGLYEVGGGFYAKLRWERAGGKVFRLGRAVSPEDVVKGWAEVTDFDKASHPGSVAESMAPIMDNVTAGPSLGGNKFIDVDQALGYEYPETQSTYTERDLSIYALGVGAAHDPLEDKELALVYEMHSGGFRALPTYAVIPVINTILEMAKKGIFAPGLNYGLERLLHGEQYTEVLRPLPPAATLTHKSKITHIWDKGKGAIIVTETQSLDEDGDLLAKNVFTAFIRGAGGWGGERGPSAELNVAPERAPDAVIDEVIPENQALLYRLSGDWNPLHVDPAFATSFGFDRPILHGLCTYGYAGRHVISAFAGGDPRTFKSIQARFAESVFPGETLTTEMWKESETRILFRCRVKARDVVVISNAAVEFYEEIPTKKTKAPVKVAASALAAAKPVMSAAVVFKAIGAYLGKHPELIEKVATNYLFELSEPAGQWTIDLKEKGTVLEGAVGKADCTIKMLDSDFMAMTKGEADAQKLFFSGKMKISGDIMASQKLDFLSKLDPKEFEAALGGAPAAAAAAVAVAVAPAAPAKVTSGVIFQAIGAYLRKHQELIGKVATKYLFELADPASQWTIDLRDKGTVLEGAVGKADCTIKMSDADFMAMTKGEADAQKLFFSGKMKISGDIMASQKLDFLSKLDPKEFESASASAPATAAPVAAAKTTAAKAVSVFEAIKNKLAANKSLAAGLESAVLIRITEPDGTWLIDATGVTEGGGVAATTVTLTDEDLASLASGEVELEALFMRGKLRVDGVVGQAKALAFLEGIGRD